MGRKIALGCMGLIVLVLVAGGFFVYSFVYRPFQVFLGTLEEIHAANEQIENQEPYTPPTDGELTEEQVARFVAVQNELKAGLEGKLAELEEKYEDVGEEWQERDPTFREVLQAAQEAMRLYADAKRMQVEALNRENFSLAEYHFVRGAFYRSLGHELFGYNLDQLAELASEGELGMNLSQLEKVREQPREAEVPEKNRQLVAPYAEQAEDWLVFAWFGL